MRPADRSPARPGVGVVIVTYRSEPALRRTLPALLAELGPDDQLVVVDNASGDGTLAAAREMAPAAEVVANPTNIGFAAAANQGAALTRTEIVLLLNPDAAPAPGFGAAIRRPWEDRRGWAAWQGLVTAEEGRVVNTSGGVVHFTGIAWAGEAGVSLDAAGPTRREAGFASGACLAVTRAAWEATGGFRPGFFMYCEDVDLSLRLRLAGERVGVEPAARVDHEYEFAKGAAKWRRLEANRWRVLVGVYPTPLLVLLAPALLATELALLPAAFAAGWGRQKVEAMVEVAADLPGLLRERRAIQRTARLPVATFASWLVPELSSRYLGRIGRLRPLGALLRLYWRLVLLLLRRLSRARASA